MATPIRIKRSAVPGKRPQVSDLQVGELALNTYDAELVTLRDRFAATGIATDKEKKVTRIINKKVRPKTGSAFACKTISIKSDPASAERAIK